MKKQLALSSHNILFIGGNVITCQLCITSEYKLYSKYEAMILLHSLKCVTWNILDIVIRACNLPLKDLGQFPIQSAQILTACG